MQALWRKIVSRFVFPLFVLALALPLPAAVRAADDFFVVDLQDLVFSTDNGRLPAETLTRLRQITEENWHAPGSLRVELAGGEAYFTPVLTRWRGDLHQINDEVRLVVRARAGAAVVQGVVFLPEPYHFALPDTAQPTGDARASFYQAKEDYYTALVRSGVAGSAWFRHQAHEARVARLGDQAGDAAANENQWERQSEFDETYAMFSGGRALSENIQLDRLLDADEAAAATEPLAGIEGITIEEIDWEPLLAGAEPELDPLSRLVPADQHALFFGSFTAMAQMIDEAQRYGTPLLRSVEPTSEDARTLERYQRQLCLTLDFLSRQFGPQAVKSVAITGSDPYFRTGTDVAVLLEADGAGLDGLVAFLTARYAEASDAGAGEAKGQLAGHEYLGVVTPDRSICSYLCRLEGALVVTNSLAQLEQILAAESGEIPALAALEEYKFFRLRYDRNDPAETGFLMVSDATIRRWCGPRWRIATSRRTRAMAILAELQARHVQEVATGFGAPARLDVEYDMADMGELTIDDAGPASSVYGTLAFNTPIRELEFELATRSEVTAYERYRSRYQSEWRQFFDPIGVQFSLGPERIGLDLTVMPLVESSDYQHFIDLADGVTFDPAAGDPHAEALAQFIFAVNKDSRLFRSQDGFMRPFAPDAANPLGWLGDSVTVYIDEDPFWADLAACEDEEAAQAFLIQNYNRLPIAIRAEVGNSFKAAAFLVAFRSYVEETAPGLTEWGSETYRERSYVTISGADPFGPSRWTLYYSVTPEALVLTLNEDLLKRSIDRELDRAAALEAAEAGEDIVDAEPAAGEAAAENPHAPPAWLGESVALRVDGALLLMFQEIFRREYLQQMQTRCYANLAILNEWHTRYPGRDPLELHEQLFKTRLVCPGGGEYVWNEELQTMESTVYGSPADPRDGPLLGPLLSRVSVADFGLTFENDGLRARMQVERLEE